MNTGEPLDPMLSEALRQAGEPPATPRDAMWARIETERRARRIVALQRQRQRRFVWVGAAAAAVLLLGIGIGRFLAPPAKRHRPPVVASTPAAEANPAYRLAAVEHFTRFEVLLTQFQANDGTADVPAAVEARAQQLLQDTRLLLDSPAATDSDVRGLLEDLETVLAQMVQAGAEHGPQDRKWIAEGVNQQGVIDRLRLVAPISPAASGNKGVY